tara:strand:+ start:517 stop:1032 length:516 start_codon:yes stop_codon:yes gene_type:complete
MNETSLIQLEKESSEAGLLLRIQVRRPLNLWSLRVVVAEEVDDKKIRILGEMKAWAYSGANGLQLDTMLVQPNTPIGVGDLIWAATMLWALEETPCQRARLLAIHDEDNQHTRLIRYFSQRGFRIIREVAASLSDLPLRTVWGGAGSLMLGNCKDVLAISLRRWRKSKFIQ